MITCTLSASGGRSGGGPGDEVRCFLLSQAKYGLSIEGKERELKALKDEIRVLHVSTRSYRGGRVNILQAKAV